MLRKNGEIIFVPTGPIYLLTLFHKRDTFVTYFFWIVRRFYIYRLKLGFVNVFIEPIRLSCFNTLSIMHLRRSIHDIVDLKCCWKWAAELPVII